MSGKVPLAAFCEEYDEDAHVILPETRQVASIKKATAHLPPPLPPPQQQPPLPPPPPQQPSQPQQSQKQKAHHRHKSSHSYPHPLDIASDSGYSSRTVTDSQSGAKSPLALDPFTEPTTTLPTTTNINTNPPPTTTSSKKKERKSTKERRDKMQSNPSYPSGPYHGSGSSHNRSSSTSRPKENGVHVRHYPGACWECDNGIYHSAGPSTPLEYPYYMSQPSNMPDYQHPTPPPPPPPMPAAQHPSSYAALPPPVPDVNVNHSSRPSARSSRSNSYHANGRPLSFHGMMPGGGSAGASSGANNYYNVNRYEHGPPLSASAYANSPSYGPANYGPQPPYYSLADYGPPPEHGRERSMSSTREYPRGRRSSVYGPPMVDYDPPTPTYDDGEPLDRVISRDSRTPMSPQSPAYEPEEDYYRMPPPPIKPAKTSPQIIQKRPDPPRKSVTTTAVPGGRRGSTFDMSDMDAALPGDYTPPRTPRYRRSRENLIPERSRSLRSSRNYRDSSARPARLAVEGARRRRAAFYNYDDSEDDLERDDAVSELMEKQREAEEYQASKSKSHKSVLPLTEDSLYKTKASRAESDSGSQKSRSNSSRASDARTHSGSNAGTNNVNTIKEDEDKNLVMTMNGVTMSFTQESMNSKKINLRTNNTGALELSVEGKRPKKYLTSGSEYSGAVARREIEPPAPRQIRDRPDRPRSERASRRSSRSTYNSGRFLA